MTELGASPTTFIESMYQDRVALMPPQEKVARMAAMFQWTREQLARRIVNEQGEMGLEELKWQVALRLYHADPEVREMIERQLTHVSR
jgi:hypothetical protein